MTDPIASPANPASLSAETPLTRNDTSGEGADRFQHGGPTPSSVAKNSAPTGRAYALPSVPPECPCVLDVYVGTRCRVWVTGGPPETETERAARQETQGEDYFPRFAIQIEVKDEQYYDCWDASDAWDDVLA